MPENHTAIDQRDPRLDKARKLLIPMAKHEASLREALLTSVAFAATALMLVFAIVMGPGWEEAPTIQKANIAPVIKKSAVSANAMMVQVPSETFELSATPLPTDGINEAVPLSEDELSAHADTK
ncbi:hypothetical protein [Asticcacaulis machinosus]|uniref:Uncharacterized protein n=1 Tax=Asticcacaulis machinosus TaxID=2984211 RepID=A0ABT5HEX1_9CAUL|nr:hypothetical protein [Asticcacaulis machinosus]MDC7674803.1 hypothetical protein [Asticcacaulis machinosus]